LPANDINKLTASLQDAQVDLTPHQVEAALFAFKSPLSKGAILADEVGLGKTIEAGIILSQHWAEHKRKLLIICPANLRKQWSSELQEKFSLESIILEKRSFDAILETGNLNPFTTDKIVICSYQFAKAKASYIKHTEWDLVIIDEAHRLRNVYKPTNKISNVIKSAIESRKKILLTATPLQNSILELYGLVSIIDDFVFGDLKSFKTQFSRLLDEEDYNELRERLQPICKRTLRRQVLEYIKYTKRIAILQEFFPTKDEQNLYDLVSEYLTRPKLYALPNSQRQLMTLILRKLLASSSYAIHDTFCSLISRLEAKLKHQDDNNLEDLYFDFDGSDEEWIDDEEIENDEEQEILSPTDIDGIKKEITDLYVFRDLAAKIKKNSKAEQLFTALDKGFEQLDSLGANKKALIFTESRRTQEFLYELLEKRGYKGKVVRFNGTNTDRQSTEIYKSWIERHKGSHKVTGSPTADRRAAIVDYFREEATIMIATEAAAEGINLQFCSLIVNYDMPWNPQRIEQRIGRCHRYGQKFDVVVINFLNKANAADIRVYELLDQKFQLFSGVFGASDEVLGSIGNGLDFEKRIAQIYNECRTTAEIEQAFDELQEELQAEISDKMLKARSTLLENFDESVQEKLRFNLAQSLSNLDLFEKRLWLLVKYALRNDAVFDNSHYRFTLNNGTIFDGNYFMTSERETKSSVEFPNNAHPLRIGSPLTQAIIKDYIDVGIPCQEIVFDYSSSEGKTVLLEELVGKSGWMRVEKVSIDSFEQEDHLLLSSFTDDGMEVYSDVVERMLMQSARITNNVDLPTDVLEKLTRQIEKEKASVMERSALRNEVFFDEEMDKLDTWAGDMKVALEREIKDLDAEIKLRKSNAKKLSHLAEKVAEHRIIKELENKRAEKRQNLYEAQDEVDARKDTLLSKVERMLEQKIEQKELFTIKWRVK
jgi:ERCC4-related helicase